MKDLIYDKNDMKSFKTFYEKIYSDLKGKENAFWTDYENLCYNADDLNEFLWNYQDENLRFVLKNFDVEKINLQKTYDDYEWNIILRILNRFISKYPNNKLEFVNDEK